MRYVKFKSNLRNQISEKTPKGRPYSGNKCPLCYNNSLSPHNSQQFHSVNKEQTHVLNTFWSGVKCQICGYTHGRSEVK
jgi:hypothetical protein